MTRTIYFVRHGQEQSSDDNKDVGGNLSPLGIEQAIMTSAYFKELRLNNVYASFLPRARQTAEYIIKNHPNLELKISKLLQEGIPNIPVGYQDEFPQIPTIQLRQTTQRFNQAYQKFIRPAVNFDSQDLVVCHNNIIRFFLISALKAPKDSWIKFELYNCSISKMVILSSAKILLEHINTTTHLPDSHLTYY